MRRFLPAAAVLMLLSVPLFATTAVEMSDQSLAQNSEQILIGECTDLRSEWVDRVLVTRATIRVSEWLKGSGPAEVVVTLPGGSDSNRAVPVAMNFPGAPELRVGEKTFLFLVQDGVYGSIINGFSQGKYSIVEHQGEQLISRDLTNIQLSSGTGVVRGGTTTRKKLSDFKTEVRGYLGN